MKIPETRTQFISLVAFCLVIASCAGGRVQNDQSQEIAAAAAGPSVINAHSEPSTIELNRNLQPTRTAEIIADVKDFKAQVTQVQLKFVHVPIEIQMQNVGGTTWKAQLSPEQLQMLAVNGKTMKYDANIVAQDAAGQTATSLNPVTVSVKSPNLSSTG